MQRIGVVRSDDRRVRLGGQRGPWGRQPLGCGLNEEGASPVRVERERSGPSGERELGWLSCAGELVGRAESNESRSPRPVRKPRHM